MRIIQQDQSKTSKAGAKGKRGGRGESPYRKHTFKCKSRAYHDDVNEAQALRVPQPRISSNTIPLENPPSFQPRNPNQLQNATEKEHKLADHHGTSGSLHHGVPALRVRAHIDRGGEAQRAETPRGGRRPDLVAQREYAAPRAAGCAGAAGHGEAADGARGRQG